MNTNNFIERESCPVCGSLEHSVLISLPLLDNRIWHFINTYYGGRVSQEKLVGTDYKLVECSECGLIYQEFVLSPENMELLYEQWISPEESLLKRKHQDPKVLADHRKIIATVSKQLNKLPRDISVLEYGMGWGWWLLEASKLGYQVTGVELSEIRGDFAQKSGIRVISEINNEPEESYDFIFVNQVLEHLVLPVDTLVRLKNLLKKDGIVYVSVPQGGNVKRRLKNQSWEAKKDSVQPLEHINCFTRSVLIKAGREAGLKPVSAPYIDFGHWPGEISKSFIRYIYNNTFSTKIYFVKA